MAISNLKKYAVAVTYRDGSRRVFGPVSTRRDARRLLEQVRGRDAVEARIIRWASTQSSRGGVLAARPAPPTPPTPEPEFDFTVTYDCHDDTILITTLDLDMSLVDEITYTSELGNETITSPSDFTADVDTITIPSASDLDGFTFLAFELLVSDVVVATNDDFDLSIVTCSEDIPPNLNGATWLPADGAIFSRTGTGYPRYIPFSVEAYDASAVLKIEFLLNTGVACMRLFDPYTCDENGGQGVDSASYAVGEYTAAAGTGHYLKVYDTELNALSTSQRTIVIVA